ncbi:hypothetical protein GOODEAATRI_024232 [Goodea atripinnis]|uniref:SH3 domain-containing protein n=1 Tax=Goodea atripinnis TaxID=208336 RepID=A0ABV0MUZ0_9TELE
MENCCRSCCPCLTQLWNWIWPGIRYPPIPNQNLVIANPGARPAEIRTVSGEICVPLPKKRPAQLYAALYDFQARSDDELTVKEGDKLSVIEKRGEFVLAKKLTGSPQSGLIPANYVALLQDEFAKHKDPTPSFSEVTVKGAELMQVSNTLQPQRLHYLSSLHGVIMFQQNSLDLCSHCIANTHTSDSKLRISIPTSRGCLQNRSITGKQGLMMSGVGSTRSEGKVFHFRIQRSVIGAYFFSDKLSFATLGELISYYQKNPHNLGVNLVKPCAQQVR